MLFKISSLLLLLACVSLQNSTLEFSQIASIFQNSFSLTSQQPCQFRFPIQTTSDFTAFFHFDCQSHQGDSLCNDGYQSTFQIEQLHIDSSISCVHLTDNTVGKEFDDYQLIDNGVVMIYNIPHPDDFPDYCDKTKQLQFKIAYNCNPDEDKVTKVELFNGSQLSCTPELFIDSKEVCQYVQAKEVVEEARQLQDIVQDNDACYITRRSVNKVPKGWSAEIETVKGLCMVTDLHHLDPRCHDDYPSMLTLEVKPPHSKMRCIHLTDNDYHNFGTPKSLGQNKGYKLTFKVPNTNPFPQRCGDKVNFTIFYICNQNVFSKDDGGHFFNGNDLRCHSFWKIQSKFFCKQSTFMELFTKSKLPSGILKDLQTSAAEEKQSSWGLPSKDELINYHKYIAENLNLSSDSLSTTEPLHYNKFWQYIHKYDWFFTIVMVILGIFYVIFGLKMFKITIFLFAMVTVVAFFLLVSFGFIISDGAGKWVGWVILAVGVVLGVLAGWCLLKCVRIGIFLLGAWPGAVGGLLLYNLFLHYIAGSVLLWIVVGVLFITGGVIALCLEDHAIIIGTSVLGSYLIVRGLSLVIGKYPNEFTVYDQIEQGSENSFSWQFILYLLAMAGIAVFGIIYQERKLRDEDDDEKEKRHNYVKLGKSNPSD